MKRLTLLILPLLVAPLTSRGRQVEYRSDCPVAAEPASAGRASSAIKEVQTLAQLEEFADKDQPIIVKIYTTWCGPCKQMAPVFEKLAQKYPEVIFVSHNAESGDGSIKRKFGVQYFPTVVFINKKGQASVEAGFMGAQELDYYVQAAMGKVRITDDGPDGTKQVHKVEQTAPAPVAAPAQKQAQAAAAPQPAPKAEKHSAGNVTAIHSMQELEQHRKEHDGVIALYIGTAWCGPCKQLYPKFEKLAGEHADVRFLKIDGDEPGASPVKGKYLKFGYPNIILIDKAGKHKNIIGDVPVDFLKGDIASVKANGASQVEYTRSESDNPVDEYRPAGMGKAPEKPAAQPAKENIAPQKVAKRPAPTAKSKAQPARNRQVRGRKTVGGRNGKRR